MGGSPTSIGHDSFVNICKPLPTAQEYFEKNASFSQIVIYILYGNHIQDRYFLYIIPDVHFL